MPAHRLSPRVRTTLRAALAAWVVILAVTLLAPSATGPSWLVETVAGALSRLGVPDALAAPARVEFGLNVAAFVPLSLLGAVLWPRLIWRDWTALGFASSFLVEVVQAVAFDARSATHADVVANTLGTLIGALLGHLVARILGAKARKAGASEGGADLPDRHSPTEELEPPR
ncbi:VanZ family protein [uncultured Nocardioides sp.]|uniref:VanZ family protein n=1 Tax=uncultured Nocardioides sp. TaxID=198441 RepID=UPI0026147362|nr:VanZ family protein [uncultured Nocardioides sp.]